MKEISKNLRPCLKGRPLGSRHKIAEVIIRDIAADC
jgi:hypothetical protein